MLKFMKTIFCLLIVVFCSSPLLADEFEYNKMSASFKNFVTCELTRTDATNHFKGKPFKITMIDLFDVQKEADLTIVTGAVECYVGKKYLTLYVGVGLKNTLGKEQVVYYTIRNKDFSILATEIIKYPYKERCNWSQYWIDLD